MIPTSSAFPFTQPDSETTSLDIYSSGSEKEDWIQPSINRLAFDYTHSSLVAGIYARSSVTGTIIPLDELEAALAYMAADPDIQREIKEIQAEFDGTEADGLTD